MNLFTAYFLLLFGISNGRPPECNFQEYLPSETVSKKGLSATCNVRIFREELLIVSKDLKALPIDVSNSDITSLSITCKRKVIFVTGMGPSSLSTFSNLEELSLIYCKFSQIPEYGFSGQINLRRLTINSHYEDWPGRSLLLNTFSFVKLSRLEMLNLSFNNIFKLPEATLCYLPSLKELNLSYNKLLSFDVIGLSGRKNCSTHLHQLILNNNEIQTIHVKNHMMSELRSLSLKDNKITWITEASFLRLFELRNLDLSNNFLETMSSRSFAGLSQLRGLNLANNKLTKIPSDCFMNLEHLLSLNMSTNQLNFVFEDNVPFEGLIRLVILDLSNNAITNLPLKLFQDVYSLQILHLQNNLISIISGNTFSKLANLHSLDVSNNKVNIVTGSTFSGLTVLALLNASHNYLSSISFEAFENCSSLFEIDLSVNNLTYIPKALSKSPLLRKINISSNKISAVDGTRLGGMRHLESLILSHNEIKRIDENSFRILPNLHTIDISFNMVSEITNMTLGAAKSLSFLDISNNKLTHLYGMLLNATKLTVLNASYNFIEWFDYAMLPQNIKVIDISNNKINKLGNHYRLQDQMKILTLDANNNLIAEINSLSVSNSIRKLYLKGNIIDFVASNTFAKKKFISVVDLSNNNLTLLSKSSVRLPLNKGRNHSQDTYIYLAGNNLECDCEADWLLETLQNAQTISTNRQHGLPIIGDASLTECKLPGIWKGKIVPILALSSNNFLCTYRRHCFPVCHCCEFDACDCEQTCPQYCSCYHDHTWEHNIVDCGDAHFSEIPNGLPMDVTESYIDGNNITVLSAHSLIGKKYLHTLYLNHSSVKIIDNKAFNGLPKLLILRLDNNLMETLLGHEFNSLNRLRELHLNDNKLRYIPEDTFMNLNALRFLALHNNRLTIFPLWKLSKNMLLNTLSIQNNRWSCDCHFVTRVGEWLQSVDFIGFQNTQITCYEEHLSTMKLDLRKVLSECRVILSSDNIRTLITYDYVMLISIGSTAILLLILGVAVSYTCRKRAKPMFSFLTKHLFAEHHNDKRLKLFDFFISYSAKDTPWVCGCLLPELDMRGYSSCLAHRDAITYHNNIDLDVLKENILCCRRVIIVLSKNFLCNDWTDCNFRLSHILASKEFKKNKIVFIFMEPIESKEIDSELSLLVNKCDKIIQAGGDSFQNDFRKLIPYRNNLLPSNKLNENSCNAPLLANKTSNIYLSSPNFKFEQILATEKHRTYLSQNIKNYNSDATYQSNYWESFEQPDDKSIRDQEVLSDLENPYMIVTDFIKQSHDENATINKSSMASPLMGSGMIKTHSPKNFNKMNRWIQDPSHLSSSSKHVFFV